MKKFKHTDMNLITYDLVLSPAFDNTRLQVCESLNSYRIRRINKILESIEKERN